MSIYALIGAGGFGKEVMPFFREMHEDSRFFIPIFVDDKLDGQRVLGAQVKSLRYLKDQAILKREEVRFGIAIGESRTREMIADELIKLGAIPYSIFSRRFSNIQKGIEGIGEGAVICPFATINASARIGRFVQMNIYSYIAHDCEVGDFVTLAPGAKINGNCDVRSYAYIGTGAILLPGVRVGIGAVIGAGAVVTKEVPPGEVWAGVPAKRIVR